MRHRADSVAGHIGIRGSETFSFNSSRESHSEYVLVTWVCTHAAVEGQHVVQPMESGIPAPPRLVMWTIETVYAIAHHNLTADARPSAEGARRGACLRAQAAAARHLGRQLVANRA